jgi:hypothetical protein
MRKQDNAKIPQAFFIPEADHILKQRCKEALREQYRNAVAPFIQKRLEQELKWIKKCKLSSLMLLASKVIPAIESYDLEIYALPPLNGSFVAYLLGITEINPLPPHFHCPYCDYAAKWPEVADAWDCIYEETSCPRCGKHGGVEGHNLSLAALSAFAPEGDTDQTMPFSFAITAKYFYEALTIILDEVQKQTQYFKLVLKHQESAKHVISEHQAWLVPASEYENPERREQIHQAPPIPRENCIYDMVCFYPLSPQLFLTQEEMSFPLIALQPDQTRRSMDDSEMRLECAHFFLKNTNIPEWILMSEEHKAKLPEMNQALGNLHFSTLVKAQGLLSCSTLWTHELRGALNAGMITERNILVCRDDFWEFFRSYGVSDKQTRKIIWEMRHRQWDVPPRKLEMMLSKYAIPEYYREICLKTTWLCSRSSLLFDAILTMRKTRYTNYAGSFDDV